MIASTFEHLKIAGISTAVPTKLVKSGDYDATFGKEIVEKIVATTGVQERYYALEKQTASDLAFVAAQHLLDERSVDPASVGILLFAVTFPDYITPSSAMVLQKRLHLSQDCIAYDMNLGCSGTIYGLQTACALLQCSSASRALVLVADTSSKVISHQDTSCLLFGDAGAAILIEKTDEKGNLIRFGLKSDGERFKAIIVPAGGFRNPNALREPTRWGDGNYRSDYNLYMNGADVFNFTMTDVPALFREFIDYYNVNMDEIDALVMHQPNLFILKHLARKLKVPMDKVPLSLIRYGNTGGASIPVTICDYYGETEAEEVKLMLSGFGIGLSWGVTTLTMNTSDVLPIIHTDDYYRDGCVSHNE